MTNILIEILSGLKRMTNIVFGMFLFIYLFRGLSGNFTNFWFLYTFSVINLIISDCIPQKEKMIVISKEGYKW